MPADTHDTVDDGIERTRQCVDDPTARASESRQPAGVCLVGRKEDRTDSHTAPREFGTRVQRIAAIVACSDYKADSAPDDGA